MDIGGEGVEGEEVKSEGEGKEETKGEEECKGEDNGGGLMDIEGKGVEREEIKSEGETEGEEEWKGEDDGGGGGLMDVEGEGDEGEEGKVKKKKDKDFLSQLRWLHLVSKLLMEHLLLYHIQFFKYAYFWSFDRRCIRFCRTKSICVRSYLENLKLSVMTRVNQFCIGLL